MSVTFENINDGETVYQRALLIKGTTHRLPIGNAKDGEVAVYTQDSDGTETFPMQAWPVTEGRFTALVMLSPGPNKLIFRQQEIGADESDCNELSVHYTPLLQQPPLYLAVMVAKDSPLIIDCPPVKHGRYSSAHSSIEATLAKVRMTAYMWQALTAEDMRMKGLGRRSFRLEEEWTTDTTSQVFAHALHTDGLLNSGAMRSTARIHVVRSDKTVKELQDPEVAQQNGLASRANDLHEYFTDALTAHGAPFESSCRPVVAGLILDSAYSISKKLILGHAALGAHNATGLSLGIFGSHLTYSWPRFVEEITSCLLDTRCPGDTVGNDNGECGSLWEACSIGQGAFLHEVGHAFGAPHTTGIMARGYSGDWPRNFLTHTAFCTRTQKDGFVVVHNETTNNARWDLRDALSFKCLPHFWQPGDVKIPRSVAMVGPRVEPIDFGAEKAAVVIHCPAGIAEIRFNDATEPSPTPTSPTQTVSYPAKDLESRFDRAEPLKVSVVGMNGKSRTVKDIWRHNDLPYVRIPGCDVVLNKTSISAPNLDDKAKFWKWATLLTHKAFNGKVEYATKVDVRTGLILDGAYVYFGENRVNCGPRNMHFGGHASEEITIPKGQEVVKVDVSWENDILRGLHVHLRNGTSGGALSGDDYNNPESRTLEAPEGERIVGFFGRSYWQQSFNGLVEFGMLTAPEDFELPDAVYAMEELQNTDGGLSDVENDDDDNSGSDDSDF